VVPQESFTKLNKEKAMEPFYDNSMEKILTALLILMVPVLLVMYFLFI